MSLPPCKFFVMLGFPLCNQVLREYSACFCYSLKEACLFFEAFGIVSNITHVYEADNDVDGDVKPRRRILPELPTSITYGLILDNECRPRLMNTFPCLIVPSCFRTMSDAQKLCAIPR